MRDSLCFSLMFQTVAGGAAVRVCFRLSERIKQLVFGDETIAILNQIRQNIEDLTIQFRRLTGMAKFVELFV